MDDKTSIPQLFEELPDEQTEECFRLALALIRKRQLTLSPLHYALCFHYSAGLDQALRDAMDQQFACDAPLHHQQSMALFQQYLMSCADVSVDGVKQGLLHIVDSVSETVADVSASSAQRVGKLRGDIDMLRSCSDLDSARTVTDDILQEAVRMQSDSERLLVSLQETRSEVKHLEQQLEQARKEASVDALTELANRRAFDRELARLLQEHESPSQAFALVLIDVDHFKQVNDRHGHLVGDKVLRQLANRLKARTRKGDTVARYGGEEFAMLLPRTRLAEARNVAEQACLHIRQLNLRRTDTGEQIDNITASFGVVESLPGEGSHEIVHRADKALYEAKQRGRNRVVALT